MAKKNHWLSWHSRFKGEVRAICRFWVFDGNGLLGHQLIDCRWFEKNPPTESGWKRRSKKTPTYRYFARKWSWRNMCFQIRAISSRLWFTYIFAFDWGSLSITGGWRKCGTLLIFLSNCSTCVPVAAPGRTGSPRKRICRGMLPQKTRNWSIWQTAHGHVAMRGHACARLCSGKLVCTFSLRTNASSSVPSLHFLASICSSSLLAPRSSRSTPDRQPGVLNDRRR